MGCETCKDRSKKRKVILPKEKVIDSYNEGDDGWAEVEYIGKSLLRIRGCESRHIFLFNAGDVREVDVNDALCLDDREDFKIVESEESETKIEQEEDTQTSYKTDDQVHEESEDGF